MQQRGLLKCKRFDQSYQKPSVTTDLLTPFTKSLTLIFQTNYIYLYFPAFLTKSKRLYKQRFKFVLGLPLPPQDFRLDTRTSNAFTVRWDSSDKLIKKFELIVTSDNLTRTINKLSTHNLATVDGLKPDTKYMIRIRTRSLTGLSNFTDPLEVRTMGSGMWPYTTHIAFVF